MACYAKKAGDLDMIAIHNKGGAAGVIKDMVAGDAQVALVNAASTAGMIKAGHLRPLAIVNETRLPDYPDVPTMKELGLAGSRHARLAGAVRARRHAEGSVGNPAKAANAAMQTPAVQEAFKKQNFNTVPHGVARRRQDLADGRNRHLEEDHRRREGRDALTGAVAYVGPHGGRDASRAEA